MVFTTGDLQKFQAQHPDFRMEIGEWRDYCYESVWI